jgi:hypothetical protein
MHWYGEQQSELFVHAPEVMHVLVHCIDWLQKYPLQQSEFDAQEPVVLQGFMHWLFLHSKPEQHCEVLVQLAYS